MGTIKFHEFVGNSYAILFSHPADHTPVCTTELALVQRYMPQFKARGIKPIALSLDSVEKHKDWIKDILAHDPSLKEQGITYPIIADEKRELAVKLGMLDAVAKDDAGLPLPARALFIVGPDKKLKLSILYPATTGRNFDEVIRVIDSLQLTAEKRLATPGNWKGGDACIVVPSVTKEEAPKLFPLGVKTVPLPSRKEYLRFTPDPRPRGKL